MGIYDREYYRDDSRLSTWFSGVAPACRTIIVINIIVYILEVFLHIRGGDNPLIEFFSASSPAILEKFQVWRLFTAPFLHNPTDVFHIVFNMMFLYLFGREMETAQGTKEFLCFYLLAAVVSTLGWAIVDYNMPGGRSPSTHMMGASGAIMAVSVLFTLTYPNREVLVFFILPMRMWVMLVIFLAFDILSLLQQFQDGKPGEGTRIAFASHLSGALFGYIYRRFNWHLSQFMDSSVRQRPRLRVISPPDREPLARKAAAVRSDSSRNSRPSVPPGLAEDQLDTRLDEVLAKILREGKNALTEEEKSILDEASRRARSRRSERS